MAIWLTVYCTRSVAKIGPKDIRSHLAKVDFHTVAEGWGIDDEDVVDQALSMLRMESTNLPVDERFRIHYRPAESRPLVVYHWKRPERLQQLLVEALEQVAEVESKSKQRIQCHLDRTIEVLALELGWGQLEDMGIVLAGQVAEYYASRGDGLIQDQNDDWWAVEHQVPVLLIGPKRRG
jgi:hypothetical protein